MTNTSSFEREHLKIEYLERYLVMFELGNLVDYNALRQDPHLSEFRVTIEDGEVQSTYLLDLLEKLDFDEAPFVGRLLTHLSRKGLPVSQPKATLDGVTMTILSGRPTFLFDDRPGSAARSPTIEQCRAMGSFLGDFHKAGLSSGLNPPRQEPGEWLRTRLTDCSDDLGSDELTLASRTMDEVLQSLADASDLVEGIIHGLPVRDNIQFEGDVIRGVTSCVRAQWGILLGDLAIAAVDWCCTPVAGSTSLDGDHCTALASGYSESRPISKEERAAWPALVRLAALELWLEELVMPRSAEGATSSSQASHCWERFAGLSQLANDFPRV